MPLNGVITSYDAQRRCGFIKENEKSQSYYFAKVSMIDKNTNVEVGQNVIFDLFKEKGQVKEPVAVRIMMKNMVGDNTKFPHPESGRVRGRVIWYSDVKQYGFAQCETNPPTDAFLHVKHVENAGITRLARGERLNFILVPNPDRKYQPLAVDIMREEKSGPMTSAEDNDEEKLFQSDPHHPKHINPCQIPHEPFQTRHNNSAPHANVNQKKVLNKLPSNERQNDGIKRLHQTTLKQPQGSSFGASGSVNRNFENPVREKIRQQLHQKQSLMRSLDISKLPDGGRRIQDQITELELKLKNTHLVKIDDKSDPISHDKKTILPRPSSKNAADLDKEDFKIGILSFKTSAYKEPDFADEKMKKDTDQYYGGRMTIKRLDTIQKMTADAIEKLHGSLHSCPSSDEELNDPDGLTVSLMPHQKQALQWLVWRESQSVNGGVLADDMGLGKTLTMISLILKQIQNKDKKNEEENDDEKNEDNADDVNKDKNDDDAASDETSSCGTEKEKVTTENGTTAVENTSAEETLLDSAEDKKTKLVSTDSTLIVAPASLIYHWESEIRNRCKKGLLSIHLFHGSSREKNAEKLAEFDVVITTYDIVRRCKPKVEKPEDVEKKKKPPAGSENTLFLINWRRVILDEAHQIRNFKSQTSEAVCALNSQSRWALSGTPVQNQENDMYAMIKFLHCHPFNEWKLWRHQVGNKSELGKQRLKTLVSSLVLRREKSQKGLNGKPLIPLPKRNFEIHRIKLNEVEQEVYNKLKLESHSAYMAYEQVRGKKSCDVKRPYGQLNHLTYEPEKKMSATSLLVMLLRLRQCCGHLSLLGKSFDQDLLEKEKESIAVEDLFRSMNLNDESSFCKSLDKDKYVGKDKSECFEISSTSSKIKFVMDTLHKLDFEQPNDKCVFISQWTSMLRVLAHHLQAAKFSYAVIEGSVSARKRMDLVDEFNRNPSKPKVMLVSLQAGGVGLNLVGGNHLFLLDLHWNPALEKQAFDRIYRVGQKKNVFVHKFVVSGTVEEQILQLQEKKINIAKAVMEGADTDNRVRLSLADMRQLFGL
ncbi:transcription termination factor 2-like isoform X3 [Clavelina lepadiformis]|uniref:transcription termination factor 2-like isoform X3 n=1 Tax=Clavelina lepadiformis TaxID=159417 RepID=UPI0040415F87